MMTTTNLDSNRWWAHTEGADGKREELRVHLARVAEKAAQFAAPFSASDEAHNAGLLHDLGKYGSLFQRRLEGKERGIDHWTAGAWKALRLRHGVAAALAVEGHHIGLQKGDPSSVKLLAQRLMNKPHPHRSLRYSELDDPKAKLLFERFAGDGLSLRPLSKSLMDFTSTAAAMLDVRMLFSALVDADFLETEAHFEGKQRPEAKDLKIARWLLALDDHIRRRAEDARKKGASESVLSLRSILREQCRKTAGLPTGLYTLTAPTGTGKTLALLEFALRHAEAHSDLRRIVFVAPYLSILDQTADAVRAALGLEHDPRVLLEHHSLAVERLKRQDGSGELERTQEMLAENWDSPIVVTTNVQFFESLFSNRPSACRKLHRLAGAVLCFDEVQSLPLPVVLPTLAALARLSECYGATVVFSTATQPAFASLSNALKQRKLGGSEWSPREINTQQREMFHAAQRVEYTWPGPDESLSWSEIADWMLQGPCQALCVLNTKRQAVELFLELNERPGVHPYHLSTAMCPEHRRRVLDKVRALLDSGVPCPLVSTQCVEAGVDLDFPRVFRALGPLDSIVQAAGRCNRNQRAKRGEVRVFRPTPGDSPEYPKDSAYRNAAMLARKYCGKDLNDPEIFSEYYRELYCVQNVEREESELHDAVERKDFEEVARLYRIVDENSVNVLAPYGDGPQLAREVRQASLSADWIRRARPYCVNVSRWQVEKYAACFESVPVGHNRQEAEDWRILIGEGTYHSELGIQLTENPFMGVCDR